jgi:hypothetical protein
MSNQKPTEPALQQKVDALVEFVHRGGAPLLDVFEVLEAVAAVMHPNGSTNYEYRFAWNDDCDPDSLEIDWKRPRKKILQRAVKTERRLKGIQAGARMTAKEKQAYRLELARVDHRYKTAQERLDSNDNCKWVDLSYVEDSQGRRIYIMEVGDAVVSDDEDLDTVIDKYDDVWNWKRGPLTIFGPFRSVEEAEEWMAQKGAFEEA